MIARRLYVRCLADRRAMALPEFGLILLPLCMLLVGTMEVGYQAYVRSVALGALETLARSVTLQSANATTIETELRTQIKRVAPNATIDIVRGSANRFNSFGSLERLTLDKNGNGVLDKDDCWEDVDRSGTRNIVSVGYDSIGGADDIVRYTVNVTYDRLLPLGRLIGVGDRASVNATTLVRRQPYEAQGTPPVLCKP